MQYRIPFAVAAAALVVLASACGQAASPATSTRAPEPTKPVSAPTAAPSQAPASPTPAPVKKVEFPEKNRAIQLLVGRAPGGSSDISARLVAGALEKELGTPVEVVNKAGANTQLALTDVAKAKPDGYTLMAAALPTTILVYKDPRRQAVFTGLKDFQPIGLYNTEAYIAVVKADSPFKTMKDLVDAAKAKPETVKAATSGVGSVPHVALLETERVAGVKFRTVHFEDTARSMAALLGDHVDVDFGPPAAYLGPAKSGQVRFLGVMGAAESEFVPGVKTMQSQGFNIQVASNMVLVGPAGIPSGVVDILTSAQKRGTASEEYKKKARETGADPQYLDPTQTSAYWTQMESQVQPLLGQLLEGGQ